MSRARYEGYGAIHHVVPQGMRRSRIVRCDRDRTAYLQAWLDEALARGWVIHAGSLLDTHDHRLVETPGADLGAGMQRVLGGYARRFNQWHDLEGPVFTGRFWSKRMRSSDQLLTAGMYVDLNPVAAGLCRHPLEWPWGTYALTRGLDPRHIIRPIGTRLLELLGATLEEGCARYRELLDAGIRRVRMSKPRTGIETWTSLADLTAGVELRTMDGELP